MDKPKLVQVYTKYSTGSVRIHLRFFVDNTGGYITTSESNTNGVYTLNATAKLNGKSFTYTCSKKGDTKVGGNSYLYGDKMYVIATDFVKNHNYDLRYTENYTNGKNLAGGLHQLWIFLKNSNFRLMVYRCRI